MRGERRENYRTTEKIKGFENGTAKTEPGVLAGFPVVKKNNP